MKEKTVFKIGDRVFDYQFGWGKVISSIGHLSVKFEMGKASYNQAGCKAPSSIPTLSFTEYTLEGFSQARPVDYNDYIGKWGMFWDYGSESRLISRLKHFYDRRFQTKKGGWYDKFKPLTDEQIKILEL